DSRNAGHRRRSGAEPATQRAGRDGGAPRHQRAPRAIERSGREVHRPPGCGTMSEQDEKLPPREEPASPVAKPRRAEHTREEPALPAPGGARRAEHTVDAPARGFVPEIVRRAVLTGVGALFMTEEGIRNLVGDMKLPKDALGFLLSQADKTRSDVTRVVTQEVRRFLESDTMRREIWKLLTSVTLEVNAEVRLK